MIIKDMTPAPDHGVTYEMMINEMQKLNKLAVLKEEEFIIRALLRGRTKYSVLMELKEKYPKEKITDTDLNQFCDLYRDVIHNEHVNIEKGYVRRLLKSQEGLTNELINLAVKAKDMVNKYDDEGDNTNAVAALRTAADIFMKFAKVQGLANEQPEININMQMDKVITEITGGDSAFKQSVLKVLNEKKEPAIIDIEVEDGTDR